MNEEKRQEILRELRDGLTADYDSTPYMKEKIGNAIEILEDAELSESEEVNREISEAIEESISSVGIDGEPMHGVRDLKYRLEQRFNLDMEARSDE